MQFQLFIFTDIHMIFNLVDASTSFQATETWTPICLPKFNDTGFLHAYVCYLPGDSNACLLLISTNREKFFELKQCKERVIEVRVCRLYASQLNTFSLTETSFRTVRNFGTN